MIQSILCHMLSKSLKSNDGFCCLYPIECSSGISGNHPQDFEFRSYDLRNPICSSKITWRSLLALSTYVTYVLFQYNIQQDSKHPAFLTIIYSFVFRTILVLFWTLRCCRISWRSPNVVIIVRLAKGLFVWPVWAR